MRPELLIEATDGAFLLEMSPDIRLQSTRFQLPSVKDVLISHWHFDHMSGLHELHSWVKRMPDKLNVYCSTATAKEIEKEYGYIPLNVIPLAPFQQFSLLGISITPLPVYHMFKQDESDSEEKNNNTFAYLLESDAKRFVYLADYYRVPERTLAAIKGVDVVLADGTYLCADEYKKIRFNHIHGDDIVRFTTSIGAKNVFYHSISHLTQKTHEELQKQLPPGHTLTHDGMRLL
jgi:phosphoribosyl 1,2-cyclic phosphodiesterase